MTPPAFAAAIFFAAGAFAEGALSSSAPAARWFVGSSSASVSGSDIS